MSCVLGIDTSNYTTSVALFDGLKMLQKKQLLPVKQGERGFRQSDAVFYHTRQLPELLQVLFKEWAVLPDAVGVSLRPREQEGSYMPCFTVGSGMATGISSAMQIPKAEWSHQHGHIAAALYSCGHTDWFGQRFLAFHVSGGTTEALLVTPDAEKIFRPQIVAKSLDLKAGQAVDRVGVMLGLSFPAGPEMDLLARESTAEFQIRPVIKDGNCSLSGIENQCQRLWEKGTSPSDIARYCVEAICAAVDGMTAELLKKYGRLPIAFAGGVMSNSIIQERLSKKYGASFAAPAYSCDNAAGIAYLTYHQYFMK